MQDRGSPVAVRIAERGEIDHLARLWHEGWHDAHASFAPAEVVKARTVESFAERLAAALPDTFVMGRADPLGSPPAGFFMLKGDQLKSFYVARAERGSGAAATLLAAAEAELARRGFDRPWLACGIGNDRAARFYEKCGWRNAGVRAYGSVTKGGVVEVQVWRFEKPTRG
jgi:GNAT superfamily N-acetyltransferase